MKKLLLIAVVAEGLMIAGTTRSDAQVYFSIGFGPGYYGYYPYGFHQYLSGGAVCGLHPVLQHGSLLYVYPGAVQRGIVLLPGR